MSRRGRERAAGRRHTAREERAGTIRHQISDTVTHCCVAPGSLVLSTSFCSLLICTCARCAQASVCTSVDVSRSLTLLLFFFLLHALKQAQCTLRAKSELQASGKSEGWRGWGKSESGEADRGFQVHRRHCLDL